MPLMNKCKTFKEEDVCKAKILAWVRLIENVNNKLPEHFAKVVVPFLNYCFGLTNLNESGRNIKINEFELNLFLFFILKTKTMRTRLKARNKKCKTNTTRPSRQNTISNL